MGTASSARSLVGRRSRGLSSQAKCGVRRTNRRTPVRPVHPETPATFAPFANPLRPLRLEVFPCSPRVHEGSRLSASGTTYFFALPHCPENCAAFPKPAWSLRPHHCRLVEIPVPKRLERGNCLGYNM